MRLIIARNAWKKASSTKAPEAKYGAAEYYQHNRWSYYDLESKLSKFRLPQPSNRTPTPPPFKPAQPAAGQKPAAKN